MNYISQPTQNSCVPASLAMIFGKSFQEMNESLKPYQEEDGSIMTFMINEYLADHNIFFNRPEDGTYDLEYRDYDSVKLVCGVHTVEADTAHAFVVLRGKVFDPSPSTGITSIKNILHKYSRYQVWTFPSDDPISKLIRFTKLFAANYNLVFA